MSIVTSLWDVFGVEKSPTSLEFASWLRAYDIVFFFWRMEQHDCILRAGLSSSVGGVFDRIGCRNQGVGQIGAEFGQMVVANKDLMLARGDLVAAEACWRRAIAVARAQGAASWELRAATRLAHLLADRGAPGDGATLLGAAFAQIQGGRATPDVVASTALLRELRAGT